jgi:hypothetical protein
MSVRGVTTIYQDSAIEATWAFVFLYLGCASIGGIFLVGPLAYLHFIDNDTGEGLGMALGLTIAPAFIMISIILGAWHLWRKWTGADQPSVGLNLDEDPPGAERDKR